MDSVWSFSDVEVPGAQKRRLLPIGIRTGVNEEIGPGSTIRMTSPSKGRSEMTTPFWCLLIAILLPYVFAALSGYYKAKQFGSVDMHHPRAQAAQLTGAGARAYAAQQNAWEALPVFGFSVIVAHLAGVDAAAAATTAMIFVAARIVHGAAYIANIAPLRSLAFGVGIVCCIRLFWLAA